MAAIYVWPSGDWAYREEIGGKPEPGYVIERVPDHWTDERVDEYVQQILEKRHHHEKRHEHRSKNRTAD